MATYKIRWTDEITIRYRGKCKLPLPEDAEDVYIFEHTPDIASKISDNEIYGAKRGKGSVYVSMNGNRGVQYYVNVEYEPWQWLIIIFFFGFAWYI